MKTPHSFQLVQGRHSLEYQNIFKEMNFVIHSSYNQYFSPFYIMCQVLRNGSTKIKELILFKRLII